MHYAHIPAAHTPERFYPVFHFTDLPADVQDAVIERDQENPPYDLFAMLLIDNFDLEVSEYFVPKMKEVGITVDTHDVRTMGGKVRTEPSVYWSTEPCEVTWEGSVCAERFLETTDTTRYSNIPNLLSHDPCIRLETERNGKQSVEIDWYAYQENENIETFLQDIETLEADILETYRNLSQEMTDTLRRNYEYLGSDSWYRDEHTEGNLSEALYLIDGTEFER